MARIMEQCSPRFMSLPPRSEQNALEDIWPGFSARRPSGYTDARPFSRTSSSPSLSLISTATDTTIWPRPQDRELHGRQVKRTCRGEAEARRIQEAGTIYRRADPASTTAASYRIREIDGHLRRLRRKVLFLVADPGGIFDLFKPVNVHRMATPVGDRILQIGGQHPIGARKLLARLRCRRAGGEGIRPSSLRDYTRRNGAAMLAEENPRRCGVKTPFVKCAQTGKNYGPITISFGLCMASEGRRAGRPLHQADRALYAVEGPAGATKITAAFSPPNWRSGNFSEELASPTQANEPLSAAGSRPSQPVRIGLIDRHPVRWR